ncbi:hypothetical protein [Pedobacter sp. WC2423]|uniref:hypothetical protein n=1 Tax=Pedobacter sp. WC2423 TaxID=3234142 RepID=UPI00346531D3
MENIELLASAGHYLTSFFKMEVLSDESFLDFNSLSRKAASIYFHEYMHYIQDIATCHGLLNINRMVEYIRFANLAIKRGKQTFSVPILPIDNEYNVQTNIDYMKVLNGDTGSTYQTPICNIKINESTINKPNGEPIMQVTLYFNDTSVYHFGGTAIM